MKKQALKNELAKISLTFFLLLLVFASKAQSWDEVAKTFPFPFQRFLTNLNFGSSVDLDGDYAVIGITSSSTNYKQVSVLKKDSNAWHKIATLNPPDIIGFGFGAHVAIEDDVIVVGFPLYSSSAGRVYVYEKPLGGWVDTIPSATLSPSNGAFNEFGSSLAISNNTIVVGQLSYSAGISGRILVYEEPFGGWVDMVEGAELTPSSALNLSSIEFGSSVSIDSNVIVAGANNEIYLGEHSGTAYIFEQPTGGWVSGTEVTKIYPSNGGLYDKFGTDVSISKNNIAVGSPSHDSFGNESGATYVYTKTSSSWVSTTTETAILSSSLMDSLDNFGQSVSINDSAIVVGAPNTYLYPKRSGVAFIYKQPQGGWVDTQETGYFISSDRYPNDLFGYSVVVNSGNALVGATGDDDFGPNSGSAYFFSEDSTGWQTSIEDQKTWPDELLRTHSSEPHFGSSVAIDDRYAVVGTNSTLSGSTDMVYILYFNDTTWKTIGTLFPSDPAVGKRFGASVAIEGDLIVVGAQLDGQTNFGAGAIYLYEKPIDGWRTMSQSAKLTSSLTGNSYNLGKSVSISGDVVVGGAPQAPSNQTIYTGAVFLYEKPVAGWHDTTETAFLTYDQAVNGTQLGFSVEIDNNVVIAGAPNAQGGNTSGIAGNRVCVFEKPSTGWTNMNQTAVLTKSSGLNDEFGYDVSIDSTLIAVSAWKEYNGGQGVGRGLVYLFEKPTSGWIDTTESHVLTHTPDAIGASGFGTCVDIDADTIVVGAMFHASSSTSGSGAIYTYVKESSGWKDTTETRRYYPHNALSSQRFGGSIEIDNGRIIVGSIFDNIGNVSNGAYPVGSAFLLESCSSTLDTIVLSECNNYVLPSGYVVTSSGLYQDYIDIGVGCDSTVVFNLTITDVDTTIYVSVNDVLSSELNADTYQWLDCDDAFNPILGANSLTYTPGVSQGNYSVELTKNGCTDTTNCILYLDCYPTFNSLYVNDCGPFTSPSGNYVWSVSGTYLDTLVNAQGCDSVITVFYQDYTPNTSVIQNNNELTSVPFNQIYQWVDCDNGFSPISGADGQIFTPTVNGNYAVVVSNTLCSDTSSCYGISTISLPEIGDLKLIVSPNPTNDLLFVYLGSVINRIKLEDMFGKTIYSHEVFNESTYLNMSDLPNAVYILSVLGNDGSIHRSKVLKGK